MIAELQATPGVTAVALASRLPMAPDINMEGIRIQGHHQAQDEATPIDRGRLVGALRAYLGRRGVETDWDALAAMPAEALVSLMAMLCPFGPTDKQALLEAADLGARSKVLTGLLEAGLVEGGAAALRH